MREITFKYDIGNIIKDEKRDLVIIKQEIRVNKSNKKYKYYQYTRTTITRRRKVK